MLHQQAPCLQAYATGMFENMTALSDKHKEYS